MKDKTDPPTKSTAAATRKLGPFSDVPCDQVKPAGWQCPVCRKPVEKLAQPVPGLAAQLMLHSCDCGSVVTHKSESQPDRQTWAFVVDLLKEGDAKVIIFDGAGSLAPGLSGVN